MERMPEDADALDDIRHRAGAVRILGKREKDRHFNHEVVNPQEKA